jgi:hypothetical protein
VASKSQGLKVSFKMEFILDLEKEWSLIITTTEAIYQSNLIKLQVKRTYCSQLSSPKEKVKSRWLKILSSRSTMRRDRSMNFCLKLERK